MKLALENIMNIKSFKIIFEEITAKNECVRYFLIEKNQNWIFKLK